MLKDDALVVQETREIVATLPTESRSDIELIKAIAGSLREGHDRHDVEIKAEKLARQRLEVKVDHGFMLVNHKFEKEQIHRDYLQKNLLQLQSTLDRTVDFTQKIATQVVMAEAKADSAKDLAKNSRWANFDPLTGMVICAGLMIVVMILGSFVKVQQIKEPDSQSQRTNPCGVEASCTFTPVDKSRAR